MVRPVIIWFRRDLRLSDHAALTAAASFGRPVIPVFIREPHLRSLGAASLWRLEQGLRALGEELNAVGSRLILREGPADQVIAALIKETGAGDVHWSRRYDPDGMAVDRDLKVKLHAQGIAAQSHPGFLLQEPWVLQTQGGTPFRVFTPFWKSLRGLDMGAPVSSPANLHPPAEWPSSERLSDWRLSDPMHRGGPVLAEYATVGETAAQDRLAQFIDGNIAEYPALRDQLGAVGTSGLSENLTWGEISPREIWTRCRTAMAMGNAGAEAFLRQLAWRDFAWYLYSHRPDIDRVNWTLGWENFPWRGANGDLVAWQRGQTGEPIVDAAMRELYATGRMHNRARMITASFLTKHLLVDWRHGLSWFADCLTDWDAAANAMGWQWVAGSGPDASPFFRVFNPATQAQKFDTDNRYRRRWATDNAAFHRAVPLSWRIEPKSAPPMPIVDLNEGRLRALQAYAAMRDGGRELPINLDQNNQGLTPGGLQ